MLTSMIMMILLSLSTMLFLMAMMLSKKSFLDQEKMSPFECGFDPKSSARLPFSLQFFLIAVIFIIFDVEITILMPFILLFKLSNPTIMMINTLIFIIILLLGLYHEWNQGALNWTI
uniref:NADH-ubiquinone oxidoreductase chain 3 n=1 Tax=Erotides cosnardi TaxID=2026643 RepID=A0A343C562_9COLE|nr:NADH dehydrogenase subunit 3 [Erotides cosnardi]